MKIRELASQFSIVVLSGHIDRGAQIKVSVTQAGYEVQFISDRSSYLEQIRLAIPHVIIFDLDFIQESLSEFVQSILKISNEIKLVPLADDEDFEALTQYSEYGVAEILSGQSETIDKKVVWTIDRICESLYLSYQNEELLKLTDKTQTELQNLQSIHSQKMQEIGSFRGIELLIQAYKTSESKEQILNLFFDQLQGFKAVYFKYLPTVRSLMVTHGVGYPASAIQGVGCQLQVQELQDLASRLALGVTPASLTEVIARSFQIDKPNLFPLFVNEELEGIVIVDSNLTTDQSAHLSQQFSLFSMAYGFFALEKKIDSVNFYDSTTEVFNARYYTQKLQDEVQRARRLKHPLSVVKIAVDDYDEIEQSLGADVRDHILKTVAQLMVKNSRSHDFVARTNTNELALVLVHCSKRGAGLRADRLRRAVESTSVLDHGVKLSVSVGISEYPSLCDSAEDLNQTSTQALQYIYDKGGNRLCLYKAAAHFRPEFEVTEPVGDPHVS